MRDKDISNAELNQITVIGDGNASAEACRYAERLGQMLAQSGYTVITGGGKGIMEAVCKGAFQAGGITVGILPTSSTAYANRYCTIKIPTGLGHARNAVTVLSCKAVVAIGGGAGTLSEICYGWIHQKPIFVFDHFAGWSQKLAGKPLDNKYPGKIRCCSSIEELLVNLQSLSLT